MPDISQKVTFQVSPTDKTCFANPHDMFREFLTNLVSAHIELTYPLDATGDTPPAAGDRTANGTWRRTVNGVVVGEYTWNGSYWVAPFGDRLVAYDAKGNPTSKERRWTIATLAEIKMLDRDPSTTVGEDPDETVSDVTGPFWEVDTDFDGRIPMSPGDIPNSSLVIAVGEDKGNGEVELTMKQLPQHGHTSRVYDSGTGSSSPGFADFYTPGGEPPEKDGYAGANIAVTPGAKDTGKPLDPTVINQWGHSMDVVAIGLDSKRTVEKLEMMPAVRGVFCVKRTARKYLRFPG